MTPFSNGVEVGLSDDIDAVREETLNHQFVSCIDAENYYSPFVRRILETMRWLPAGYVLHGRREPQ